MKITNRVRCVLFTTLILGSISQLPANVTSPSEQIYLEAAQEQEFFEFCLKNALKQLEDIEMLFEEFQLIIDNNGIKAPNKRELIEAVKHHRLLIQKIKDNAAIMVDAPSLQTLIDFIDALIEHAGIALNKGFNSFEPLNIEPIVMRGLGRLDSFEELENNLQKNHTALENLKVASQSIGLTWYNKAYRTFDAYFIQPGQKHRFFSPNFPFIGPRSKIALALGGLATYMTWRTHPANIETVRDGIAIEHQDSWFTYLEKKCIYPIRKLLGYPISTTPNGINVEIDGPNALEQKPLGTLGKYDYIYLTGAPFGIAMINWSSTAFSDEWKNICTTMDKKAANLVNTLKGGAYKDRSTELNKIAPKITLDDLVGLNEVKDIFSKIVTYVLNPESFDRTKLDPSLGFLLTGPSRTGKTYSAEALAGSIRAEYTKRGRNPDEFNFFFLNASFINEAGIDQILEEARVFAPCILFIDEIDLLGLQRTGGNAAQLSKFLVGMNKLKEQTGKPVILIAATNRPENLDFALCQPGRFGAEIRFKNPIMKDRVSFLTTKLNKVAMTLDQFDIERLALETENCSFEDINAIIRSAFLYAKIQGQTLTQEHIDRAFDREKRHILFNNDHILSAQESRLVAAHIAGQALALELLSGTEEQIAKATLLPYMPKINEEAPWLQLQDNAKGKKTEQQKISHGKVFSYHLEDTTGDMLPQSKHLENIKRLLAGFAAEELLLGTPSGYSYHKEDVQTAYDLALRIASAGLAIDNFPDDIRAEYLRKAIAIKQMCEKEILELLTHHRPALEAVMNALLAKKILSGQEIKDIIAQSTPALA